MANETRELQHELEVTFRGKVNLGNYDLNRLAEHNSMSTIDFLNKVKSGDIDIQYELTDNILIDEVWETEEVKLSMEKPDGEIEEIDLPTSGF
tara:strand:+ start:221 stop:499 length:279 start_codon:yes stop_codon:yes gene_type:complete